MADVDQVGQSVPVHVAEEDARGVVTGGEAGAVAGRDALAPPTVAEARPVRDVAVLDEDDVLQAVTGHVGPLDTRVGEVDVGEVLE